MRYKISNKTCFTNNLNIIIVLPQSHTNPIELASVCYVNSKINAASQKFSQEKLQFYFRHVYKNIKENF